MDDLGGPTTFNHYPSAGRTRWTRRFSGPSRSPRTSAARATAWSSPGRAHQGQGWHPHAVHHVIDIAPTILEAVGVQSPSMLNGVPQKPIEGVSMVYTFDDAEGAVRASHAIFRDVRQPRPLQRRLGRLHHAARAPVGRRARHRRTSTITNGNCTTSTKDFSEANNLAAKEPKKLRELQELFWVEAAKYNVLPLDNSKIERFDVSIRPSLTAAAPSSPTTPEWCASPKAARRTSRTSRSRSRRKWKFPKAARRAC